MKTKIDNLMDKYYYHILNESNLKYILKSNLVDKINFNITCTQNGYTYYKVSIYMKNNKCLKMETDGIDNIKKMKQIYFDYYNK